MGARKVTMDTLLKCEQSLVVCFNDIYDRIYYIDIKISLI
jgi:hypothetical protein